MLVAGNFCGGSLVQNCFLCVNNPMTQMEEADPSSSVFSDLPMLADSGANLSLLGVAGPESC